MIWRSPMLTTKGSLLNCISVKWFANAEFYLAIMKVCLIFLLFLFVFITMVGGNPLGDAYGFRYWNNPVSVRSLANERY